MQGSASDFRLAWRSSSTAFELSTLNRFIKWLAMKLLISATMSYG
jgi:hypothetical protein